MTDVGQSDELNLALNNIKSWLMSRSTQDSDDYVTIGVPDSLKSLGLDSLALKKFIPDTQTEVINAPDSPQTKSKQWSELSHLVDWTLDFSSVVRNNASNFAALEVLRGGEECPISLANFRVAESLAIVESATNFEIGLDVHHPDTRNQSYAVDTILIEDSTTITDILKQVFTRLYSRCVVCLVVKSNQVYSALLTAYIVDMMHQCGATTMEIDCLALDKRENIDSERLTKSIPPSKASKLSIVAVVFKQTDTFAAAQGIIESYFREGFPNLIIMVDESAYERFVRDWQRYYSFAINIGARLDPRTSVVDTLNSRLQINLEAIDMKLSHKMTGEVINVLKFRSLTELVSLLGNLRKIPFMTVWHDDISLVREFCITKVNQCNDFWLNHIPKSISGRKFPDDILGFYSNVVAEDMANVYNIVMNQFAEEAEQLRKVQAAFAKKDCRLRTTLIIQAYISLISRSKSLKIGNTVGESVARLKKFQHGLHRYSSLEREKDSLVEIVSRPVGLAILLVRDESSVKSKAILLECIFKNLLLGNAVLLSCPANCLGSKFTFDNDHVVPFKMVHESMPDISRLSLDNSSSSITGPGDISVNKKQCPKNIMAIEILPDMNSEICDAITIALATRRKSIWYPGTEQANYWANEWN